MTTGFLLWDKWPSADLKRRRPRNLRIVSDTLDSVLCMSSLRVPVLLETSNFTKYHQKWFYVSYITTTTSTTLYQTSRLEPATSLPCFRPFRLCGFSLTTSRIWTSVPDGLFITHKTRREREPTCREKPGPTPYGVRCKAHPFRLEGEQAGSANAFQIASPTVERC